MNLGKKRKKLILVIVPWMVIVFFASNLTISPTFVENSRFISVVSEENVVLPILPPTRKITGITAQTPRTTISIIGDADFTPANGVSGGAGTKQDPFLIANFFIDGNGVDNTANVSITNSGISSTLNDIIINLTVLTHWGS